MAVVSVTREARESWAMHRGAELRNLMAIGAVLVFCLEGLGGSLLCVGRRCAAGGRANGERNGKEHLRPQTRARDASEPEGTPLRP